MRSCPSIPLRSYPTVSFLHPLAILASWRLNSPAFTHDADRIEYLRTVYRPWQARKRNRQDAKEIEGLAMVVIGAVEYSTWPWWWVGAIA